MEADQTLTFLILVWVLRVDVAKCVRSLHGSVRSPCNSHTLRSGATTDEADLNKVRVRGNLDPKISAMRWDATWRRLRLPA